MPGVGNKSNGISVPQVSTGRRGSLTTQSSFQKPPSLILQCIVVGCPKEIKPSEDRVGIIPAAAAEYISNGHKVVIETDAGLASGFSNEAYIKVGCIIVPSPKDVYGSSQMIVKVKEPLPSEYGWIREGQIVFTYFHFAASHQLTEAMIKQKAVCIAYETVESSDKSLPLLTPMSEIAGRMAIQEGAKFLEKPMGGRGVLLSGVPGVRPAKVVVLGGGVVGFNAAKIAAGMGADVIIMDINIPRLRYLDDVLPPNCSTLFCNAENVSEELASCDLVVGAVLIPGAKAPKLVSRDQLKLMKKGSLLVDVAVDQGGCIETTRVTTHKEPTYVEEGIVHYCVGNMPGAVPITSTLALSNVTLKYGLELANKGWFVGCCENEELAKGLNIALGTVVYKAVSDTFGLSHTQKECFLKEIGGKAEASMTSLTAGLTKLVV